MRRLIAPYLLIGGIVSLTNSGCMRLGASVWTEPVVETFRVDVAQAKSLEIHTHNGFVEFTGKDESAEAVVTVTKKGGGRSRADADAALAAIEITQDRTGFGTQKLGWKWRGEKGWNWGAVVNFEVAGPAQLPLTVETHNGKVTVKDTKSDAKLTTHNGDVQVTSRGERLTAETHNGEISSTFSGSVIRLDSHNGGIQADLSGCKKIEGSIDTHNGGIEIEVSDQTSAELLCDTHNGRVVAESVGAKLASDKVRQRELRHTLGSGGSPLKLDTHNGSIEVKLAKP